MSLVKQALIVEFKELATKAVELKIKIDTAKTFTKREIYKKKLKDNNIKAAEVLSAIEKLALREGLRADGVTDEASGNQGCIETQGGVSTPLE